jgi:crotonobetainyl-CoA:carnitine CoA-transferase CaiB-like acyl-CoA transferase
MPEDALPLQGLVVVEFSTSVAGPFAGQVLADLGAEVFKVERPDGGDDARHWGPPFVDGVAPVFQTLNRNKHSLAVNLKDERERAALAAFIRDRADIVVQNLRPGLMDTFGLDADSLRAGKPELIYCNMTAFGPVGPKRMQPGYDPLMQACAGIMSTTGIEGHEPVRVGPSLVDQGSGMWAVIGIMAALIERGRSGQGATIDTSLYETAVGWLPAQIATFLASGKVPGRIGTENAGIAPYKAFEAQGGWLVIAAGNNGLFGRLTGVLGRPDWAQDARFATNPARVENRVALNAAIQQVIATGDRDAWLARLEQAGVPAAPVLALDETLADPQFAALDILQPVPGSDSRLVGLPLHFDGTRPPLRSGHPAVGDRTDVLAAYFPQEARDERIA